MKALLVGAALGLSLLAAPAASSAQPLTGFDQDPLLVVRFTTNTIIGQEIESQAVIHTGGAVEIVDVLQVRGASALTSRGIAPRESFRELQQALVAGRVAQERGGCGDPAPDGPVEYHVTWYGRDGFRSNSFKVGVNPNGCPESTRRIVNALSQVLIDIYTSPDTRYFPRPR